MSLLSSGSKKEASKKPAWKEVAKQGIVSCFAYSSAQKMWVTCPSERRLTLNGLHGVTSQVTEFSLWSHHVSLRYMFTWHIRRSLTVFTTARHCTLSWARIIQSTPSHHVSLRSILTSSSNVTNSLFLTVFDQNFVQYSSCAPVSNTNPVRHISLISMALVQSHDKAKISNSTSKLVLPVLN
jgi:hypothetical protein